MEKYKSHISLNDTVILNDGSFYRAIKIEKKTYNFKGQKFDLSLLIDFPYDAYLVLNSDGIEIANLKQISMIEEDLEEDDRNNKNLKSSTENQKLSTDEILQMKTQGLDGEELIAKLKENSTSFNEKTPFSQQKYIKKKIQRHLKIFRIRPMNLRNYHAYLMSVVPSKMLYMRIDTLSQIISLANVEYNSKVLLLENCNAILMFGLSDRIDTAVGRIVNVFSDQTFINENAELINSLGTIYHMMLMDLMSLVMLGYPKNTLTRFVNKILRYLARQKVDRLSRGNPDALVGQKRGLDDMNYRIVELCRRFPQLDSIELLHEIPSELSENCEKFIDQVASEMTLKLEPILDLFTCSNGMEFDSLIIAPRFHPVELTLVMLQLMPPGKPFVIYSEHIQVLVDLYVKLKGLSKLTSDDSTEFPGIFADCLSITDSWMRRYQILPNRTHPEVSINEAASGYLLHGYTIANDFVENVEERLLSRQKTLRIFSDHGLLTDQSKYNIVIPKDYGKKSN